jgi:hypothetical protein
MRGLRLMKGKSRRQKSEGRSQKSESRKVASKVTKDAGARMGKKGGCAFIRLWDTIGVSPAPVF